MEVLSYLPGQSHSLTKKLTDREYSNREIALTCLAAGILSAAAGYTRKNAFLATGTSVFIANRILYLDSKNTVRAPMQILSFISFCSFLGLSLKQSWVKPPAATPSTWTHSLFKTTLSLLALSTLEPIAFAGVQTFGEYTVKTLDEKSSARLRIIGALTASAASTFLIPRLGYFTPFVTIMSSVATFDKVIKTDKPLDEALPLAKKSVNYPLWLLLGASIGLLSRSLLGPKNYTPSLPLFAKIPLHSLNIAISFSLICIYNVLHSCPPKEFMTYSNSFILRQSLKDGFLERIQCANNHHFTSSKALENHISKDFPEPSDFFCNTFFKACIIERETPSRQLRDVLNEWEAVIKGIT